MKLVLDQCLPRSTVKHLAATGIVAQHVADLGLASATDQAILEAARHENAIAVTLDADFHRLLAASQAASPSVIRIRIEGLKGEQLALVIGQALAAGAVELAAGAVLSVTAHRIRIRSLPLERASG